MNNSIGDALQKAFNEKKNDYSNFIWKGAKRKDGKKCVQDSVRIIDMSPEELKAAYKHCDKMLYNDNPKNLGRYNVLEEITSQIHKCNIELFLRYSENVYQHTGREIVTRFQLMCSLRQLKQNNQDIQDWSTVPIYQVTSELPTEFNDLSVEDVMDGCIDRLEAFDKSHLTMTFITKMGLWFTKAEENEMKDLATSNIERVRVAKEKLHLPDNLILRFNEKGLSYHEMKAMLSLPKKQKYKDMTTEQLTTLRNKVLFRLQRIIDGHIYSWKKLKKQIELVANEKGIDLND